jgi:hypothetical protein
MSLGIQSLGCPCCLPNEIHRSPQELEGQEKESGSLRILPALGEIYGSHWEDSMGILNSVLRETNGGEEGLPWFPAIQSLGCPCCLPNEIHRSPQELEGQEKESGSD